jgi:hypothetical protein
MVSGSKKSGNTFSGAAGTENSDASFMKTAI